MPMCYADREDPRKPEQYATLARAISEVANESKSPIDKAAKLLAVGYHEGRFCLRVHSGEHRGPGRGVWQLEGQQRRHRGPFVGLDYESTHNAARVASVVLDRSFQCGHSPGDVFTGYAGRACKSDWATLRDRVRTYRWVYWRLSKWR